MATLYIVMPCYNEEKALPVTYEQINKKLDDLIKSEKVSDNSKILFVNDGSKDKTWEIITKLHNENNRIEGITLTRNFGQQNALLAGLSVAKEYADMVITMDADLQDDINAIDEMIEKYNEGNEIVYGVRNSRKADSIFKRVTAQCFYRFMEILGANIVYNHADYRLMSKRAIEELLNFKEKNIFLRGIVPLIGLKNTIVYYERNRRVAGKTKYPLKKMIKFATDAIISFSVKPLRLITMLGLILIGLSIIMMIVYWQNQTNGSSLVYSLWMIGGVQLLCLGIVGEYVGRIYEEVKERPKYIIEKKLLEK